MGVLSAFGGSDTNADLDGSGSVDVNDVLATLSTFGTVCTNGVPPPPPPPPPPPACILGGNCGGQLQTGCGTYCPAVCGSPQPMMCNSMCFNGFQCPLGGAAQWFDPETGTCVESSDCTNSGGNSLPPGLALGR